MDGGKIIELGDAASVSSNPQEAFTKKLLSAAPPEIPQVVRERVLLSAEGSAL